jgi:NTP pyrophosphatase (non-canonical NTP hydrolase)
MNDIKDIINALQKFRDERDWKQFHDSKNLASAISIEAAELNELFLWKTIQQGEEIDMTRLKEELADVLSFSFLLAAKHDLDIKEIVLDKIKKNSEKYPISKAKGTSKKYTEL